MNVWLWGPSLWNVLHGSSQALDQNPLIEKPLHKLATSLRTILPCIQCRNSQNGFLDELGLPKPHSGLEWSQKLHTMVNSKLEMQRIDKLRDAECISLNLSRDHPLWDNLKSTTCRNLLFSQPSLEVLTKRCILKAENLWTEYDLLLLLTTFFSHSQGPIVTIGKAKSDTGSSATAGDANLIREQLAFVAALTEILDILGSPNDILKFMKRLFKMDNDQRLTACARRLQFGHDDQDIAERVRLLRAGACLNGTCV